MWYHHESHYHRNHGLCRQGRSARMSHSSSDLPSSRSVLKSSSSVSPADHRSEIAATVLKSRHPLLTHPKADHPAGYARIGTEVSIENMTALVNRKAKESVDTVSYWKVRVVKHLCCDPYNLAVGL